MYTLGQGVLQDYVKAHMWSNIAAANGETKGPKNRDIVAAKMTPQQIERAQQMARDCVARNYKRCN
jgi:TPR repeat protein